MASGTLRVLPSEWIERIFGRMLALYGASFTRQWNGVAADTMKFTWARELGGLSEAEIVRGLEACRTRDYPPTLPEFRNLCRPPPDFDASFFEAARLWPSRTGWSNPAVYWAALSIGDDVRRQPYTYMRARWREALERALRENQPLPDSREAPKLEAPKVDPEQLEAAKARAMAKLKRGGGDGDDVSKAG